MLGSERIEGDMFEGEGKIKCRAERKAGRSQCGGMTGAGQRAEQGKLRLTGSEGATQNDW